MGGPAIILIATGVCWTVSLTGLFIAAVVDFKRRVIPNPLVLLVVGCGIAIRLLSPPFSLEVNFMVAAAVLLALGLLAHRKMIGGGDVKLIAAVILLVPPGQIAPLLLGIAVVGGLLSGVYLVAHAASGRRQRLDAARGIERRRVHRKQGWLRALSTGLIKRKSVPYGVAVFGGTASIALTDAIRWLYATS